MFCSIPNIPPQSLPFLAARVQLHFLDKFFCHFFSYIYIYIYYIYLYRTLLFFKTGNADKTCSTRRRISWMMRFQTLFCPFAVTLCQKPPPHSSDVAAAVFSVSTKKHPVHFSWRRKATKATLQFVFLDGKKETMAKRRIRDEQTRGERERLI